MTNMAVKLKLMKRGADRMTYSLPSLRMLNEKLVAGMEWPADKPILAFRFPPRKAPKGVPIQDMISRRKYLCRTTYIGNKRDIPAGAPAGGAHGLKMASFGSRAEYRRMCQRTYTEYFFKPFREYQERDYKKENRDFFKNHFPKTKGISVRRGGKVVSMMSVLHMPADGKAYRPMSWITWVWVDARLSKEERKAIHGMLGGWLKRLPGKYFGGAIHAVNIRSQKWFMRMGARPVQVFFLRR